MQSRCSIISAISYLFLILTDLGGFLMLFCPSSYYSIYTGQARGNSTPFPDHLPDCIKYKSRLVEGLEESHIRRSNDPTSCLNWLTPAVSHLCMGTPHPGLTERRKSGACRRGVVWHGRSLTQFISIQRPSFSLLFLSLLHPIVSGPFLHHPLRSYQNG